MLTKTSEIHVIIKGLQIDQSRSLLDLGAWHLEHFTLIAPESNFFREVLRIALVADPVGSGLVDRRLLLSLLVVLEIVLLFRMISAG